MCLRMVIYDIYYVIKLVYKASITSSQVIPVLTGKKKFWLMVSIVIIVRLEQYALKPFTNNSYIIKAWESSWNYYFLREW